MGSGFDFATWMTYLLLFMVAVTIHEFAHAFAADRLGDPTPRSQGRISLNPIDHLDPIGTLMMGISQFIGMGIGWGKPVMTQPSNFKDPRQGNMIVAAAGPLSNLLQAVACAMLLRYNYAHPFMSEQSMVPEIFSDAVILNVSLFIFNLLPIGPLDGTKVLIGLLPSGQAHAYDMFMRQFGSAIFALLIVSRATTLLTLPIMEICNFLLRGVGSFYIG